jgi:hypothetical protein
MPTPQLGDLLELLPPPPPILSPLSAPIDLIPCTVGTKPNRFGAIFLEAISPSPTGATASSAASTPSPFSGATTGLGFETAATQFAVGEQLLDAGVLPPACAPTQSTSERASSLHYGSTPPRSAIGDQLLNAAVLPPMWTLLDPKASKRGEIPPVRTSVRSICCELRSRAAAPPLPWHPARRQQSHSCSDRGPMRRALPPYFHRSPEETLHTTPSKVHGHMESAACKGSACACHFGKQPNKAMAINQGADSSFS